jgi:hypothetical protein
MRRSPKRLISDPPAGANTSLTNAKMDTMAEAAMTLTSKDCANCGRIGATSPYPRAIRKAAATRIQISTGTLTLAGLCTGPL